MAVPVDDIIPILNPSSLLDLEDYLLRCPPRVRVEIAKARAELTTAEWARRAGVDDSAIFHWMTKARKLPLGAAFRLARIIGVDPQILFIHYI